MATAPATALTRGATVEGITEYALTNGLRILMFPDQSKGTVTVSVTYLVGSRHEGYGETGMAHLFDHMLFRGTARHPKIPAEIEARGELSIMVSDGAITHAVRKRPRPGDFRIHERYGGDTGASDVPAGAAELAERVFGILPAPALYARIDLVTIGGQWHVLEVEATEPRLYLEFAAPEAAGRFATAIAARLP